LRKTLTSESAPLAARFRALFSLKHLAALKPPTNQTVPAIEAIAAAFTSQSALLKHELAYCLGQSGNDAAIKPLRDVLTDREEDAMCRHEAAEALGALGDEGSLPLLRKMRDDKTEEVVIKETCEIAVGRIEWEHSDEGKKETLKQRCDLIVERAKETLPVELTHLTAILPRSIRHRQWLRSAPNPPSKSSKTLFSTPTFLSSSATEPCSPSAISPRRQIYQRPCQQLRRSPVVCTIHLLFSATKSPLSLASFHIRLPFPV